MRKHSVFPISAIVVTYNSAPTLAACLKSVLAEGISETIVIDNASTDASVDIARAHGAQVVVQPYNLGFASACNAGTALAHGATYLFLNPDATLMPGAMTSVVRDMQPNSTIGIVGLSLMTPAGEEQADASGAEPTLWQLFRRHLGVQTQHSLDWVSGGAMVVRANAFKAVSGFDAKFFMYWEDVDLCRRIRKAGWEIKKTTTAWAVHQRGMALPDRQRATKFYDQSADRYFRKHYATPIWILQRFLRYLYRWLSPQAR